MTDYSIQQQSLEIQEMYEVLAKEIQKDQEFSIMKICHYIWFSGSCKNFDEWYEKNKHSTKDNITEKINKIKNIINNINEYDEIHDYLCLFTKCLGVMGDRLPTRNLHSHNDLREYDPSKNAQNILKHGISFRDIFDSTEVSDFGRLIVEIKSKNENRSAIFLTINKKYICVICTNSKISGSLRAISAREITRNNINEFIKLEGVDKEYQKAFKERANELFGENYNIEGKK